MSALDGFRMRSRAALIRGGGLASALSWAGVVAAQVPSVAPVPAASQAPMPAPVQGAAQDVEPSPPNAPPAPEEAPSNLQQPTMTAPDSAASSSSQSPDQARSAPLADAQPGELNVRVDDEQGSIFVDDREVGRGQFRGQLEPGQHRLRVVRPGYDAFDRTLHIRAGEVRSESVSLRRTVTTVPLPEVVSRDERDGRDGLYGGIQLLGTLLPGGSGTTLEEACDTTGATQCSEGTGLGAGLGGYVGWRFDPLGFELALLGAGDVVRQTASFDGERGSQINPLVAAPAREEKFIIGRFGGGAALRARVTAPLGSVGLSFAAGPGLVYRSLAFRRETTAEGGFSGEHAETGISYVSPLLSAEFAVQLRLTRSFALSVGAVSWFEHAGDEARSEPDDGTFLLAGEGTRPLIQATPAYDTANGPQWFVGPFLGAAFGP